MKKGSKLVMVLMVLVGMISCKQQIPFTNEVRTQYGLDAEKLPSLQYHLVGDIVLTKGSSVNNNQLGKGEILVNESQNLDKVIFRTGTQGLFVREINENQIAISFEKSDDFYLVFHSTSIKGLYKFTADSWDTSGRGKLNYGGEEYLSTRAAAEAYITVKVKKSSQFNSSQRIAKGRKL